MEQTQGYWTNPRLLSEGMTVKTDSATQTTDSVYFDFYDGYLALHVLYEKPTNEEIQLFNAMQTITIGVGHNVFCLRLLIHLDAVLWHDLLYFYPNERHINKILGKKNPDVRLDGFDETKGCDLFVVLVDSTSGEVLVKKKFFVEPDLLHWCLVVHERQLQLYNLYPEVTDELWAELFKSFSLCFSQYLVPIGRKQLVKNYTLNEIT